MVFPQGAPMLGWEKLLEDELRASAQSPRKSTLPLYGQILPRQNDNINEKRSQQDMKPPSLETSSRESNKLSKLKSYLKGDSHRVRSMYVPENSDPVPPYSVRSPSTSTVCSVPSSNSASSSTSSSSKSSALKSYLAGDIHRRYSPMFRLEESVDARVQRR